MKNQLFYLFLFIAVVGIVASAIVINNQENIRKVNSFEECQKAGFPILESYPRKCQTPDGRTFTESKVKICNSDEECKEGFYCSQKSCKEFSPRLDCLIDGDCEMINKELNLSCCFAGVCEEIDYSLDKWIAVNKNWIREERNKNCPSMEECGPSPACSVAPISDNFKAKCVDRVCKKVQKSSEEESQKENKCCMAAKGICEVILEPKECLTGKIVDCDSIICNPVLQ